MWASHVVTKPYYTCSALIRYHNFRFSDSISLRHRKLAFGNYRKVVQLQLVQLEQKIMQAMPRRGTDYYALVDIGR